MTKMYLMLPETKAAYQKIEAANSKVLKGWAKWARETLGAEQPVLMQFSSQVEVVGYDFKGTPPASLFYKSKRGDFYIPRAGTHSNRNMRKQKLDNRSELFKLIGWASNHFGSPDFEKRKGNIIVHVPDKMNIGGCGVKLKKFVPKGCVRLSDVEYENL